MLPIISIVIPTYNEEENIKRCVDSIYKQEYPKKLLEVLLVDNYSQDKTLEIAKKYPVIILTNKIKDVQVSKMIGLKNAKGELLYFMDADSEFKSNDYLRKLVCPLLNNPLIVGSFGTICQAPNDNSLNRFLTYDILQRDPVLEYFSPSVYSTVIEKQKDYFLCKYEINKIAPEGRCLFWKKKLMQASIVKGKKFMDLDALAILVEYGFCYFAFVSNAKTYHHHVQGLTSLIKKRLRNINRNYIPHYETRHYKWFNLNSKKDVIRIILWIFYAHLIFPAFIKGLIKSIKHKDLWCLWYEPMLVLLLTDITLFGFLRESQGRKFIFSAFNLK
ncbi:MAG: glycosyltransferase family 2 protein [Candidatus Levyibacteriota bacterium]